MATRVMGTFFTTEQNKFLILRLLRRFYVGMVSRLKAFFIYCSQILTQLKISENGKQRFLRNWIETS